MAAGETPNRPKKSSVQRLVNPHDPLAERHRADRAQEEDYFRQRDQELIGALRDKSAAAIEQAMRHYACMRCPKCGEFLEAMPSHRITIDTCPGCGGIWLDKGEWEVLVGPKEHGWLQRLFEAVLSR
jgi:hypothetical protein